MANLTIKTGSYRGEGLDAQADNLTISVKAMRYEVYRAPIDYSQPEAVDERPTRAAEWQRIVMLIDPLAFRTLPRQIADMDASETGGEFVEIATKEFRQRVDFSLGSSVPEIKELLDALRELRAEFAVN